MVNVIVELVLKVDNVTKLKTIFMYQLCINFNMKLKMDTELIKVLFVLAMMMIISLVSAHPQFNQSYT